MFQHLVEEFATAFATTALAGDKELLVTAKTTVS